MSFIQIGFLSALAAVAIPIVIHLVFRQKTRRADLGTLRFLRIVLQRNARRRRVMRWFLLALRMACVALLAMLFARPYWRA
ncbi:MAG TPA: BatA domain-containing protein, partial [Pirellulales bacterium]|nr:BatA domain-containing protein [Pirellulales bacterium]